MPDFGQPVAQNVQSPNGMQTIAQILGIKQAQQNLQTGQYNQQVAQGNAQNAQQQMKERQLLQQTMQTGKDPDGNPIKTADGDMDPPALAAFANKYMPLTGQAVQQNLIKTLNDKVELGESTRALAQNYNDYLSGIIKAGATSGLPTQEIINQMKTYASQNPNAGKQLSAAVDRASSLLGSLQPNLPEQNRQVALAHIGDFFQPPAGIRDQQNTDTRTYTDTKGNIQAFQANPRAPGGIRNVGAPMALGISPQFTTDEAGNPHIIVGRGIDGTSAQGSAWTNAPQAAAQGGAVASMNNHFEGLNSSAGSMPLVNSLTHTIEGLSPAAFTGVGGDKKQYMSGLMNAFGIRATGDGQTDTNLLNKAMAQLNMSSPAGTDAARTLIEAGQPNSKMDPEAIREAAGTVRSQVVMNAKERDFLGQYRYANGGSGDSENYQMARQWFESNADPRIWQYEQLKKSNPTAAKKFISRQPDVDDLATKADELEKAGMFK